MKERIKWITYKNKQILFLDYTNLNYQRPEEMYAVFDEARDFILKKAGTNILLLIDVAGSYADSNTIKRLKEDGKLEKHLIKKEAVIGISGLKLTFVKAISVFANIGIEVFDSSEKAKDWLVK